MQNMVAAAIQFKVEPMAVEENMKKAYEMIARCCNESKANLLVLPESFTTGFTPRGSSEDLWDTVDTIPGKLTDQAVAWAKEFNCYICFPTYERGPERGIVYNSAALIGPEGILGVYRKTHPFPTERLEGGGWTTPGSSSFCVDTPIGKIGIVICYDGDFPELARVTALKGAEVICRPSAFMRTFDHWELTNRARAYDNHVYWVATNSVGPDASGAYYFGSSMIIHPTGVKLTQARACDEYVWASLEPDPIRTVIPNTSSPQIFDHIEDRNIEAYAGILDSGRCSFEPARRIPYNTRWR
jgi:predicted amidohydrolase